MFHHHQSSSSPRRSSPKPPPTLPSKEHQYPTSPSYGYGSSDSRYVNSDLASAIRASVVVTPKQSPTISSYSQHQYQQQNGRSSNTTPPPSSGAGAAGLSGIKSSPRLGGLASGYQRGEIQPSHSIDFSQPPSSPPQDDFEYNASPSHPTHPSQSPSSGYFPKQQQQQGLSHSNSHNPINAAPDRSGATPPLRIRKSSTHSSSYTDMSTATATMSHQQPQLPSQRVVSASNPFESDEIEPPPLPRKKSSTTASPAKADTGAGNSAGIGAGGAGGRAKILRAQTALTSGQVTAAANQSSPTRTRMRRSLSSGSYGLDANGRELTAGQRKALEDKKGSRHADVIDTWDPTGLGTAMWHHSGPYDAAAPSRNSHMPNARAPMQAFNGERPIQSPPKGATAITMAAPPVPPAKDSSMAIEGNAAGAGAGTASVSKRAQAALRQSKRVSGGLTGQYSTSVPAAGGYFPEGDEPTDEATLIRRERQAQRDQKRRALKAAWGIDTPEPFEDFGMSPGAEEAAEIELADDTYNADAPAAPPTRVRSPGLRLGLGPRTPSLRADDLSPVSEKGPGLPASGSVPAYGPGGVKRTKSLMQKIKGMRESRHSSYRSSHSPKLVSSQNSDRAISPLGEPVSGGQTSEPSYFKKVPGGKSSPQKGGAPLTTPEADALGLEAVQETETSLPSPESNGSGFILVESPNSKARAMKALEKQQQKHSSKKGTSPPNAESESMEVLSPSESQGQDRFNRPLDRVKGLPTPPIGPVIPEFDDLIVSRQRSRTRGLSTTSYYEGQDGGLVGGGNGGGGDGGLKRKTSMVKKLKDRIK